MIFAIVGLLVALIEYPAVLTLWMISLGIVTLALFSRRGFAHSVPVWARSMTAFFFLAWTRVFEDARIVQRWRKSRMRRMVMHLRPLAQWFIAIGLSMVFVCLFILANPVIEGWFFDAYNIVWNITEFITPLRVSLWIFVGVWSWALLRHRVRIRRKYSKTLENTLLVTSDPQGMRLQEIVGRLLNPELVVRCLISFNLVFIVQTLMDVAYLFGGAALPENLSYAAYAHRGSYPLIATTLLAGLFVLATFRPGSSTESSVWRRRLVYLWIGQNVFLTFNAFFRLSLYVDVYSLSRWRVAAAIWIGLIALGLVWIATRIIFNRSNRWLLTANFFSAAAVLYICCFINFDGFIADYNVRHCREITGDEAHARLDLHYLHLLGPESIPALQWLEEQTAGKEIEVEIRAPGSIRWAQEIRRPVELERGYIDEFAAQIREELEGELGDTLGDWRGWCYRRHRLAQIVDGVDLPVIPRFTRQ